MKQGILLSLVATLSLTGCMTYKYNNRDFRSEADALAYQQQHLKDGISKIQPAKNRVGGTLRVFYPNQEVARTKLVTGNQNSAAADYVLKVLMAEAENIRANFEKRGAFDKVELHFTSGLHREPEDAHVLYFFVESPSVFSWYYLGKHIPRTPVSVDSGAKAPEARLMYMIETVEALAAAEAVAARRAK